AAGETEGINLRIRHEFDSFVLNSQTSFQHNRAKNVFDLSDSLVYTALSPSPPGVIPAYNIAGADIAKLTYGDDTFMQEVRASSLPSDPIAWTAGVNYFRSDWTQGRDSHALTPNFLLLNGIADNH